MSKFELFGDYFVEYIMGQLEPSEPTIKIYDSIYNIVAKYYVYIKDEKNIWFSNNYIYVSSETCIYRFNEHEQVNIKNITRSRYLYFKDCILQRNYTTSENFTSTCINLISSTEVVLEALCVKFYYNDKYIYCLREHDLYVFDIKTGIKVFEYLDRLYTDHTIWNNNLYSIKGKYYKYPNEQIPIPAHESIVVAINFVVYTIQNKLYRYDIQNNTSELIFDNQIDQGMLTDPNYRYNFETYDNCIIATIQNMFETEKILIFRNKIINYSEIFHDTDYRRKIYNISDIAILYTDSTLKVQYYKLPSDLLKLRELCIKLIKNVKFVHIAKNAYLLPRHIIDEIVEV